ncbi:MAG: quinone-dependent dihydroorotate dehydrogenase [Bradymonadaceae bacterium]
MYRFIRAVLFALDAELVHKLVMGLWSFFMRFALIRGLVRRRHGVRTPVLEQSLWGLDFENPVGLAAGFDKDGRYFNALHALGFGFIEIGTVTGQAQEGNPRPRLFRLPEDQALLNRMGFNNAGSDGVAGNLVVQRIEPLLGINIGKTKVVPIEEAPSDYEESFRKLYPYGRYFVVNVSSPNTPGLRKLQNREPLEELLRRLQTLNRSLADQRGEEPRPLLLKIAPDIEDTQLDDILAVVKACELDGIMATNTTIEREGLRTPGQADLGTGGVSGRPVRRRSLELIKAIYRKTDGRLPIIGVGGIFTAADAMETIEAGASLVQVYTGFIYEGPGMVRRINRGLEQACDQRGWAHISEAIGHNARIRELSSTSL